MRDRSEITSALNPQSSSQAILAIIRGLSEPEHLKGPEELGPLLYQAIATLMHNPTHAAAKETLMKNIFHTKRNTWEMLYEMDNSYRLPLFFFMIKLLQTYPTEFEIYLLTKIAIETDPSVISIEVDLGGALKDTVFRRIFETLSYSPTTGFFRQLAKIAIAYASPSDWTKTLESDSPLVPQGDCALRQLMLAWYQFPEDEGLQTIVRKAIETSSAEGWRLMTRPTTPEASNALFLFFHTFCKAPLNGNVQELMRQLIHKMTFRYGEIIFFIKGFNDILKIASEKGKESLVPLSLELYAKAKEIVPEFLQQMAHEHRTAIINDGEICWITADFQPQIELAKKFLEMGTLNDAGLQSIEEIIKTHGGECLFSSPIILAIDLNYAKTSLLTKIILLLSRHPNNEKLQEVAKLAITVAPSNVLDESTQTDMSLTMNGAIFELIGALSKTPTNIPLQNILSLLIDKTIPLSSWESSYAESKDFQKITTLMKLIEFMHKAPINEHIEALQEKLMQQVILPLWNEMQRKKVTYQTILSALDNHCMALAKMYVFSVLKEKPVAHFDNMFYLSLYAVLKNPTQPDFIAFFQRELSQQSLDWLESSFALNTHKDKSHSHALKTGLEYLLDVMKNVLKTNNDDLIKTWGPISFSLIQKYFNRIKNGEWESLVNPGHLVITLFERLLPYCQQYAEVKNLLKMGIAKASDADLKAMNEVFKTKLPQDIKEMVDVRLAKPKSKPQPKPASKSSAAEKTAEKKENKKLPRLFMPKPKVKTIQTEIRSEEEDTWTGPNMSPPSPIGRWADTPMPDEFDCDLFTAHC